MSVRLRLAGTFVLLIGLFLVPMQYAGVRLNDLRELAVERRSQHASATLALGAFHAGLAELDRHQRAHLATLDPRIGEEVESALAELRIELARLQDAGYADATRRLARQLDSLVTLSHEIHLLVDEGRVEEATRAFEELGPLRSELGRALQRVGTAVDRRSAADFARAEEMSASAAATTIGAALGCVLLALLVGAWTTGALTKPLKTLSSAAADVADGSFEAPEGLPYRRGDEIGDLSRSFRTMTRRLAELDQMKAEFMSVASHELKTPINVIRGYTELIEEELAGEVTGSQREILDAIAEQTRRMSRQVSRLLDIGRLEAGTYRMEFESVHVDDLLTGLRLAFEVLAEENGVNLRSEVEETAPETLYADPDMLRDEVLGNLVSNALRFTPEGGQVAIRVRGEEDLAIIEVSDTGPGIPEDQRPHVFEKYYQGDRTRSMGAGLGLAVAQEVVEAHGGRITLEPGSPVGATFRVSLPTSPEAVRGEASAEDAAGRSDAPDGEASD